MPRLALLIAVALCACGTMHHRIHRDELQRDLARRFPVDVDKRVATIRLTDPRLEMPASRPDRAAVRMRVGILTSAGDLTGRARVEGRIEYAVGEHAFYLRDGRVTEIALDPRGGGASTRVQLAAIALERAARAAIEHALETRPVYTLDAKRNAREAKAIRHLRGARIDGSELVLDVAL